MKRFLLLATIVCAAIMSSCDKYDDSKVWDTLNDHENRIQHLEEICAQMNTNISSLQTIVNALQQKDYITNVAPVSKDGKEVGYTITFSSGKSIRSIMATTVKTAKTERMARTARTVTPRLSA